MILFIKLRVSKAPRANLEKFITNNVEYNLWKEKIIYKKRKDEAKFEGLDEYSEKFDTDAHDGSLSTSTTGPNQNNEQREYIPSEGSLSFTGHSSKFQVQNPPSKNTTFEIPKASETGKSKNSFLVTNHFAIMQGKGTDLNQSMPVVNSPPGFNGYMPFNTNSFDMGYGPYPGGAQPVAPYPLSPNGMIEAMSATGRLKFFDEVQNYGFLVVDSDNSDLFVHYDDLKTSKLSRDVLRQAKTNYFLQFKFDIVKYSGKYKESRKAVNLKLIKVEKLGLIN